MGGGRARPATSVGADSAALRASWPGFWRVLRRARGPSGLARGGAALQRCLFESGKGFTGSAGLQDGARAVRRSFGLELEGYDQRGRRIEQDRVTRGMVLAAQNTFQHTRVVRRFGARDRARGTARQAEVLWAQRELALSPTADLADARCCEGTHLVRPD